MSDVYTPTTERVKHDYVLERMTHEAVNDRPIMPTRMFHDEFDRWLAAHDAEVSEKARRDALEEAARRADRRIDVGVFGYAAEFKDGWAVARAIRALSVTPEGEKR